MLYFIGYWLWGRFSMAKDLKSSFITYDFPQLILPGFFLCFLGIYFCSVSSAEQSKNIITVKPLKRCISSLTASLSYPLEIKDGAAVKKVYKGHFRHAFSSWLWAFKRWYKALCLSSIVTEALWGCNNFTIMTSIIPFISCYSPNKKISGHWFESKSILNLILNCPTDGLLKFLVWLTWPSRHVPAFAVITAPERVYFSLLTVELWCMSIHLCSKCEVKHNE